MEQALLQARKPLRVLILEDNEDDCALLVHALRKAGWEPDYERVASADAMVAALEGRDWDLILSDYEMPGFGAPAALALYRDLKLDIPLLIASGSIGEEQAVAALKAGAHDFFLKGSLARLGSAVERALAAAENSRARKRAEERQKQAMQALLQSEARHRIASEMAKVGVWDWDLQSGHGYIDPVLTAMLGFGEGELPSEFARWNARIHPDDATHVERELQSHLSGKTPRFEAEYRMLHKDGGTRWFLSRGTRIADPEGGPLRIVGASMDVSDRRGLEEQFQQSQKMEAIGRLAGGVAHDFNNLLGVITGYGEMLLGATGSSQPGRQRLEQILRAAERAAGLTRQLLAFSRRQVLEPKVLDLNAVVSDVEPMLRRLIGEDVRLVIALQEGLSRVRADPGQLEQVIVNLAVNARDAMPSGGQLVFETSNVTLDPAEARARPDARPGTYVRLSVADNGQGMDEATLARVFEPFFTTKEPGKGTGLGLATIHGIVTQSGGHVTVRSERGKGSAFAVYLPTTAEEVATSAVAAPASTLRGTEHVLVVEDEPAMREVTADILSEAGYRVSCAEGSDAALAILARASVPPDLLLTDVVLPGMSGPQLVQRARSLFPAMRVAFVSGYTRDAVLGLGVGPAGGVTLLQKPFTSQALLQRVREALDAAPAH
jgi:PAS domain S-box-containing protein